MRRENETTTISTRNTALTVVDGLGGSYSVVAECGRDSGHGLASRAAHRGMDLVYSALPTQLSPHSLRC